MNIDWQEWTNTFSSYASPRFSLLTRHKQAPGSTGTEHRRVRDLLLAANSVERQEMLAFQLKEQIAKVLGTSASKLDSEQPLNTMGLDSLMMVELKNRIEKETGISLPTVELMAGPSISELSSSVLKQLSGAYEPSADATSPRVASSSVGEIKKEPRNAMFRGVEALSSR